MKLLPLLAFFALAAPSFSAELPRVFAPGELPADPRLGPLKDFDGYFPFTPPASREAWGPRAEAVRLQMRVALGIWPEPARTPLHAVRHGRLEGADYTVEKVFFESMPGFFVTGNLYRPKGAGPFPAVLCPHGHWKDARFALRTDAEMEKEIASGGERFRESGRSMFQSLGVQLARMGIVALVYDMLGYCDSQQIDFNLAHRFARQRPEMNTRTEWGLFSPQAEAHAQSILGLQTWNSIRALDFLTSMPEVDARRLGCTGASGGGTQTMILGALDPRLAVECPAVMVSTAMQGGCTCENSSLLRVGTGNVEFAALFAPKPLGMTAANDWTKELETKGFPELQRHFAVMGAPQNVALWPHLQFGHNYNIVSREDIYGWFDRHFGLKLPPERLTEREFPVMQKSDLTVWSTEHPAPQGGEAFERRLLQWWHDDAQEQLSKPGSEVHDQLRAGWRALIGWPGPGETAVGRQRELQLTCAGRSYRALLFTRRGVDGSYEIPMLKVQPPGTARASVLWLGDRGKESLFDENGELRAEVGGLLEHGAVVTGLDLFEQGEFLGSGPEPEKTRRVKNPREAGAFTFGYNHALFAQRVHDILNELHAEPTAAGPRLVVALGAAGPIAAAALAIVADQAGGAAREASAGSGPIPPGGVARAVLDTHGFRFGSLLDLQDPSFLPAAAKYGDLPGALSLVRRPLYLLGESGTPPAFPHDTAAPARLPANLILARDDAPLSAAMEWLLPAR